MTDKIKCNDVLYRQGFVEVANVHAACVNLEIWNVHPDVDLTDKSLESMALPDEAVIGNTEVELNVEQAKLLVQQLQVAIIEAERGAHNAVQQVN